MAEPLPERTQQANRGPERSLPDFGDIPARAREEAERELGPAAVESLKPAFDDEEDTQVIMRSTLDNRRQIESLCQEFLCEK